MLTMLTVIFRGADCSVFLLMLTMLTVIFRGADCSVLVDVNNVNCDIQRG